MALLKCPDCGNDVSDQAPACPHCGRPLGSARPLGASDKGQTTRPDWWHDPNVGCLGAALLVLALVLCLRNGCG